MKFVHIADMHFDTPFKSLSAKENLGEIRRLEQRKIFKQIIEFIKENYIQYLFIAGDLYEHEYVKQSTIEYINSLFREIPNTKIFISPGNHDPYIKNSYYKNYNWAENVYIFKDKLEKYEDENVNIYGMAFTEFYMEESLINHFALDYSIKPSILVAHIDLNGSKDEEGFSYNPILESKLNSIGFDYIAMGHIHKNNIENKNRIYYPGSTISLGFDEIGEHGMIVGEISKESFHKQFIPLDTRVFTEIVLNVENFTSREDMIEHIVDLELKENFMYKLILIGKRNFEINIREILKVISRENILKIKDITKTNYNIEEIARENNLRGIFIREVLKKLETGEYTEKEIEKAIEIGLEAM